MAEPAYKHYGLEYLADEPDSYARRRQRLDVIEPPRPKRQAAAGFSLRPHLVALGLALAVVVAIPFSYIWLVNDTMRMLVRSEDLQLEVSQGLAQSHQLESEYSALTNPQHIQRQANEMGMAPDPDPQYIHLDSAASPPLAEDGAAVNPDDSAPAEEPSLPLMPARRSDSLR